MIKTFPFRLDIEKEYNNRMYSVNSNDLQTVKFTFVITDNGIPLNLTGLTVRIAIRKPDKKAVWQDCTITNGPKGEGEVILTNQAYIKKGEYEAELMLYKGTDTVAITQKFHYRAAEGIMSDKSLQSQTVLGPIDQKLAQVEETLNDIRKNGTGIDAQARSDIEEVTTQLAEMPKKVNGKTPDSNGNIQIELPDTSKLATKQELQNIGSATPKGTYATLTALQTAFPTGTTGIFIVQADGNWYYWNGAAWSVGGKYQSTGIAEKVVTYKNTDFFELDPNINLYNNKDYILGAKLQPITGGNGFFKTAEGTGKIAYLKVKPNTQYAIKKDPNTLSNGTQFKYGTASFLYDPSEGSKLVDGLYVTRNNATSATLTTGATDQYLYIYFDDDINAKSYIQVLEGTQTEFVAKKPVINPSPELNIYSKDDLKSVKEIEKKVSISKNLFNRNLPMTEGYIISIDGTVTANSDYKISGKHYLEKGKTYAAEPIGTSFTGFNSVVLFDAQDRFIKRINITSSANTFMITSETEYVKFNVGRNEYNAMVNEGTTLLPYEPYGMSIESDKQKAVIRDILERSQLLNRKYIKPPFELNEWYEQLDNVTFTNIEGITYDKIYEFYDMLVANNPNYVSRTLLGKDQSDTYPIYSYRFTPTRPKYEVLGVYNFNAKLPKVIISTALHGSEKPAILTLMNIMKNISENWQSDKTLEWLRFNVEFIIVPVVNPWGFVNHRRGNVNHVDINRNFDVLWDKQGSTDPTDDRYRGTAPNSEKETQYLTTLLNENKDTVFYYDFHTLGSVATTWDKLYRFEISNFMDVYPISQVAEHVTKKIMSSGQKNHNIPLDSGHLGVISIGNVMASAFHYASKVGIVGCAPEVAYNYVNGEMYADDVNKLNVEYMLNSITLALKELL